MLLTTSSANPRQRHKHWSPTVLNFLKGLNQAFKMRCIHAVSDYMCLQRETRAVLSKRIHRNHGSDWCYHLKHVVYFSLDVKTLEKNQCVRVIYIIRVPTVLKICLETLWCKGKYSDSACLCKTGGRKHAIQSTQASHSLSESSLGCNIFTGNERTHVYSLMDAYRELSHLLRIKELKRNNGILVRAGDRWWTLVFHVHTE